MKLSGPAIVLGNNINTGVVLAARYMSEQGDPKPPIPHMFETIDPAIAARLLRERSWLPRQQFRSRIHERHESCPPS